MNRRGLTFGIASALLAAMIVALFFLPVPYVVLSPGPVTDTLGAVPAGESAYGQSGGPVIQISGARTQPTDGHLYLTTVELQPGSCTAHLHLIDAIRAWFSSHESVEPQQVQCPPGVSSQKVQQQGVNDMTRSQTDAVVAAMNELGYKSTGNVVAIESVTPGVPAASVVQAGDEVVSANGKRITQPQQLVNAVQSVTPGAKVSLVISRANTRHTFDIATEKGPDGKARLGVSIGSRPTWGGVTVSIGIDPNVIGGPSAGTALALGIVDKLTPGGLTGGRTIAGTGTIDKRGKVGPIGGIQQKIAAAVDAGATVFFAPASECADAKAAAPASLTLVSIKTLDGAVQALKAIKAGSTAFPHC
ncbi:MAG TPA: PDZ domain-containing protein [Mycobacteriales bacterium]|nr:PDZ domain-containing protein [Mycobacteriales bacterium]